MVGGGVGTPMGIRGDLFAVKMYADTSNGNPKEN